MKITWLARTLALVSMVHVLPAPRAAGQSATPTGPRAGRTAVPRVAARYESPPRVPFARPAGPAEEFADVARGRSEVDPATGEFRHFQVELFVPCRGMDFVFARTYRSRTGPSTALGHGWDFSYNLWIEARPGGVLLHDGNGRADLYRPDATGTFTASEFFREGEFLPDGRFTLRFDDAGQWIFSPLDGSADEGRIESTVDRNGNTMQFEYGAGGKLTLIRDTLNRAYQLEYTAEGLLSALVDFVGRRVTYAHYQDGDAGGSAGDLKSVTTPAVVDTPEFPLPPGHEYPSGKTTTYTYTTGAGHPGHGLLTITDPKGQLQLANAYTPTYELGEYWVGRVERQWRGASGVIDYVYLPQEPGVENGHAWLRVIRNDRRGTVDELFYDHRNRLRMQREYTGLADPDQPTTDGANRPQDPLRPADPFFFETRWIWNRHGLPRRIVHPNGNVTRKVYAVDLDPATPARHRADVRELRRLPGAHVPVGDQSELVETFEYDAGHGGRNFITRHVDARGNETLHTYDSSGNRVQTVHRLSAIVEDFEYDAFGRRVKHTRPDNGSGWRREDVSTYYGPGDGPMNGYRKNLIVDAAGLALTTTWTYDAIGNVLSVTDPRGNVTERVVNQRCQVVLERSPEVTPGSGVRYVREIFHDANDNLVRVEVENRDELGVLRPDTHFTTSYDLDPLDHVIAVHEEVADGSERVEAFQYDASENRVLWSKGEATNGNQPDNVVRTEYDERDLVFAVVRGEGGAERSETRYDYDGNGNRRAVHAGVGPDVRSTLLTFDAYDRLLGETDALGNVVETHYDANGNRVSERIDGELVDVAGDAGNVRLAETTWTHDTMDRVVVRSRAHFDASGLALLDGSSETGFTYAPSSRITGVTDDNGHARTTLYDTAERESVLTDPRGNQVMLGYDAGSNVVTRTELEKPDLGGPDELFTTTCAYDGLDRRIEDLSPLGYTFTRAFDSRSRPVLETDARGIETRREYDGLGRLVRVVRDMDGDGADAGDPDDAVTVRAWDASSRLVAKTDPLGNTTGYVHDALDRLVQIQRADGTATTATYDVHDNLLVTVDANGTAITRTYDTLDREVDVSFAVGAGVSTQTTFETRSWDGLSRLVTAADDDSSVTCVYDSLGNLRSEVQNGLAVTAAHDGTGSRTELVYPGGRALTIVRDVLDRLVTVADGSGTLMTLAYVGPGRRAQRTYANGTTTTWAYDGDRRVVATAHASPVTVPPVFDGRNHVLDPCNLVLSTTETHPQGEARAYVHDARERLMHSQRVPSSAPPVMVDYVLDAVGNRSLVNGGPDAGLYTLDPTLPVPADAQVNQYTTEPGGTRSYDENGNLVAVVGSSTETYLYDGRDRLVARFDSSAGQTDSYAYDALGRRIERVLDVSGSPQTARFVYDGEHVIEERDGAGILLADLIVEENGVLPNYARRAGVDVWLHADALDCVVAATNAAGQVVERYRYSDFGRVELLDPGGMPRPVSVIGNEYFFRGRREGGLHAIGRRLFDPRVGRFTTRAAESAGGRGVRTVAVFRPSSGTWFEWFGDASVDRSQEPAEERGERAIPLFRPSVSRWWGVFRPSSDSWYSLAEQGGDAVLPSSVRRGAGVHTLRREPGFTDALVGGVQDPFKVMTVEDRLPGEGENVSFLTPEQCLFFASSRPSALPAAFHLWTSVQWPYRLSLSTSGASFHSVRPDLDVSMVTGIFDITRYCE